MIPIDLILNGGEDMPLDEQVASNIAQVSSQGFNNLAQQIGNQSLFNMTALNAVTTKNLSELDAIEGEANRRILNSGQ